MLCITERYQKM